ncbi:hypothetical protein pb186bvf_017590 [Paramecium bursaria]
MNKVFQVLEQTKFYNNCKYKVLNTKIIYPRNINIHTTAILIALMLSEIYK